MALSNREFKRRKIKYPAENPIKDLMDLYEEKEFAEEAESAEPQGTISPNNTDDDHFLKDLIEHNRSHHRKKIFFFSAFTLFVLAGAALAGFFYFSEGKTFEQQNLSLEIVGPEKIQVGQNFEYKIKYQNLGEVELKNSKLLVQYPHGFILEKAEPALDGHKWSLGNLKMGDKGEVKLSGRLIDELSKEQKLVINLTFEPSNFHSEFTKQTSFSVLLEPPEIDFVNSLPANIALGQKLNVRTKIKNLSALPFENAKITIVYPEKFTFQSAKPNPFDGNNQWIIAELPSLSESKGLAIEGLFPSSLTFDNEEQKDQVWLFQLLLPAGDDQYVLVKQTEVKIKIIDQALNSYLIVNGSTENKTIELGNQLTFSLVAKNNGQDNYDDLKLRALIQSQPIDILDWSKIKDEYFGKIQKTETGKEIIWDKTHLPPLKKLAGGKEITINFTIPIKTLSELSGVNFTTLGQTKIETQAEIILPGQAGEAIEPVKSSQVSLTLNTNANIGAKALYYFDDGTPLGEGPLPFTAGKTTKIVIFWDLSNDLHELENVSVSASLPDYAGWLDQKSATTGEVKFDAGERKVSWEINRLPTSINEAHANFAIAVTPLSADTGKIIKLIGNTTLSTEDVATDELIIKTKNILTSALEQDDYAKTDGLVK